MIASKNTVTRAFTPVCCGRFTSATGRVFIVCAGDGAERPAHAPRDVAARRQPTAAPDALAAAMQQQITAMNDDVRRTERPARNIDADTANKIHYDANNEHDNTTIYE